MKKYLSLLILCCIFVVASGGHSARAAVISFDAGGSAVGTGSAFPVDILIDADLPVNAITLAIPLPESVELAGSSDANSVVNLWVEKPKLDDRHQVTFSGLIPGGFSGKEGKIVTLFLKTSVASKIVLSASADSVAYIHSENGRQDTLTSKGLTLTLVPGKENSAITKEDSTPPELFVPVYVQLSEDPQIWGVGFTAQDKGSGIREYFVAESSKKIGETDTEELAGLSWKKSDSPAQLEDQDLSSYVYIKAVDINGNERVARLTPGAKWYQRPIGYILMAVLLIGVLYVIFFRKNKSQQRR